MKNADLRLFDGFMLQVVLVVKNPPANAGEET